MRLTQIHRFPERLLSTVQRGTAFEHRALALLTEHLSMSLTHVGGSYDGGVDLIGWWWVPSKRNFTSTYPLDATVAPTTRCTIANRSRLRVLAQCKAEKRKMGPAYLRELEGVAYRYAAASISTTTGIPPNPSESESESPRVPQAILPNDDPSSTAIKEPPPIALLISESQFTRHCILAANASPLPFLLVHLPPLPPPLPPSSTSSRGSGGGEGSGGNSNSAIGTVFGNPALISANGLLGGELEIRWERGGSDVPSSGMLGGASAGRPRLWWQGEPLPSWTPEADAVSDVDGEVL